MSNRWHFENVAVKFDRCTANCRCLTMILITNVKMSFVGWINSNENNNCRNGLAEVPGTNWQRSSDGVDCWYNALPLISGAKQWMPCVMWQLCSELIQRFSVAQYWFRSYSLTYYIVSSVRRSVRIVLFHFSCPFFVFVAILIGDCGVSVHLSVQQWQSLFALHNIKILHKETKNIVPGTPEQNTPCHGQFWSLRSLDIPLWLQSLA